MSTNNIYAAGTGEECKANFMTQMQYMMDTIFLCKGILVLVPVVNWFEWVWEFILEENMYVLEAQYLCWSTQMPKEGEDARIAYEKFKNIYGYFNNFKDSFNFGWGSIVQAIFVLAFQEDW